ncbi:MAG: HDIG domain-containing protein [Phycisphaerae bacterium]|nr:HDIG domain-containing protein [Phycisphaerae bacterium]
MPENGEPTTRTGTLRRAIRSRHLLRRGESGLAARALTLARSGGLAPLLVALVAFVALASPMVWWTREHPLVEPGRVMGHTHTVRVPLRLEDSVATMEQREAARQRTPRVYVADAAFLDEVATSLRNLPRTVAGAQSAAQVEAAIREQFRLTDESLAALQGGLADGEPTPEWSQRVEALLTLLRARPIVDKATYQRATQEGTHSQLLLRTSDGEVLVPRGEILNADDAQLMAGAAAIMGRDAGFVGLRRDVVADRIARLGRATYRADESATAAAMEQAARLVPAVFRESPVGQVVFRRGERLTNAQFELYEAELLASRAGMTPWALGAERLALTAVLAAVAAALLGYVILFVPRLRGHTARFAAVLLMMLAALGVAGAGAAADPGLITLFATAPVLLLAVALVVGLDNRAALAFGIIQAVITALALGLSVGMLIVMVAGVGVASWLLADLRERRTLLRAALLMGLALAVATLTTGVVEWGGTGPALRQTLLDAGLAAAGGVLVGSLTLFLVPGVERAFDVATGLTLIELRDPRHPLLRELQLRAPGTYTHSLNVATIAEAAADAIHADTLLTYVGALYHDIGKMNKPEYFVENQAGGVNRHDKLSPAMSLLVIVGHVKDGMELAREFRLPRAVWHFVESHHGTTLVEYFFHRARQHALAERKPGQGRPPEEEAHVPDEFEYRYPGPRPRTREAATLMIADAVESTARTLEDPTPARIDSLVRTIVNRRLLDGQFDDCGITLVELNRISESVGRTVASLYHARVQYPEDEKGTEARRA